MKLSQSIVGTVALVSVAFAGNASGAFTNLIPFTDFNNYTTGSLSGQGGWSLSGGTTANYTIQTAITANPTGKALAINQTAGSTTAAYSRDAYKDFTASSWTNRTAGQNTAVFKWDMYVPAGGTSVNRMGAEIENSSYYSLGGIYIRPSDGQVYIRGKVASGTSSYTGYVITGSFVTLGAWNSYSVAYNSVSGVSRMSWTDKTAGNVYADLTLYSAYTPTEVDFNSYSVATAVANTVYYDNMGVYATVPSPGAVALIGLAGLVARRRR